MERSNATREPYLENYGVVELVGFLTSSIWQPKKRLNELVHYRDGKRHFLWPVLEVFLTTKSSSGPITTPNSFIIFQIFIEDYSLTTTKTITITFRTDGMVFVDQTVC